MASKPPETLPSLTALRGICAIIIIVLHMMIAFAPEQAHVFGRFRPYLTVDLFFLMSGLVMAHVYGASLARDPWRNAMSYLRARFARIYPLHFVTLVAVILIVAIWPYRGHEFDFSFPTMLLHLGMLQGLTSTLSWNHPAWSVGDEVMAYVVFLFTARPLMTGRYGWAIAAGCAVALAAVAAHHNGILLPAGLPGITRSLTEFSLGALAYRAWRSDPQRLRRLFAWLLLPGLLIAAALRSEAIMVLNLTMLTVLSLEVTGPLAVILNRGLLEWLGDWSYSIYLWHMPLVYAVTGWFHAHKIHPLRFGGAATAALIMGLVVTTVLVAAVSYHAIEKPARRLLRARRSGRVPAFASQSATSVLIIPAAPGEA
jgi:peptidoglycan/LPS O-acetylase OafA/YrhL